jgi:hypothetical protein
MMEKLREELGQLSSLDYVYQLSCYAIDGLSDVMERVERWDTEKVLIDLMSSHIRDDNVLEFVKTSVAAIVIKKGKRLVIQNKIIEGMNRLTLEPYARAIDCVCSYKCQELRVLGIF